MMEDTLRSLVEDSLSKFCAFMDTCCAARLDVNSTADVAVVGGTDVYNPRAKPPLLVATLDVNAEGNGFAYSIDPDAVPGVIAGIFDAGIERVRNIPQLEQVIMEDIFWASTPKLASVHAQEEAVQVGWGAWPFISTPWLGLIRFGFRIQGFRIQGLGFGASGLGCRHAHAQEAAVLVGAAGCGAGWLLCGSSRNFNASTVRVR